MPGSRSGFTTATRVPAFLAWWRYLVVTGWLLATFEPMKTIRSVPIQSEYEQVDAATPSASLRPNVRRRVADPGGVVDRVRAHRPRRLLCRVVRLVRHPAGGQIEADPLRPGLADAVRRQVERVVPADPAESGLARAADHRVGEPSEAPELVAAQAPQATRRRPAGARPAPPSCSDAAGGGGCCRGGRRRSSSRACPSCRGRSRRRPPRAGSASRSRPGHGSPNPRGTPRRSCSGAARRSRTASSSPSSRASSVSSASAAPPRGLCSQAWRSGPIRMRTAGRARRG